MLGLEANGEEQRPRHVGGAHVTEPRGPTPDSTSMLAGPMSSSFTRTIAATSPSQRSRSSLRSTRTIDEKQVRISSRRCTHHYMYNEEIDSSSYWSEVAYELTQYRLWTKFKNHARVVGKSAVVLSELYNDISMRPPHGQQYMVARFKSMITLDPRT